MQSPPMREPISMIRIFPSGVILNSPCDAPSVNFQRVQSPKHNRFYFLQHVFRQAAWLHMPCFNKVRRSCGIFFRHGQRRMFSMIGDRFITVFFPFQVFLYDRALFKRLFHRVANSFRKIFEIGNLRNRAASRTICRFYDNRKAQTRNRYASMRSTL